MHADSFTQIFFQVDKKIKFKNYKQISFNWFHVRSHWK